MVKPDVEYLALPENRPHKVKTIEEIDREIDEAKAAFSRPQFEDHPPAGRFFKDPSRKAKVLAPTKAREGGPVGDNVVLPKHYSRFQIEPIRFIGDNNLNFFQGNIVKYTLRYDAKNGIEDIRKVQRYARMFELWLMGHPDWAGPDPKDKELNDKFEACFKGFRELVHQYIQDPQVRADVLKGLIKLESEHAVSRPS